MIHLIIMQTLIYSKSKGEIIFKNVNHISTSVRNYLLEEEKQQLPIFELSILQQNHHEQINLNDVTSFTIYDEKDKTWIDENGDLKCPHCNELFKRNLLKMGKNKAPIEHCPSCGGKIDTGSYLKDTIKE